MTIFVCYMCSLLSIFYFCSFQCLLHPGLTITRIGQLCKFRNLLSTRLNVISLFPRRENWCSLDFVSKFNDFRLKLCLLYAYTEYNKKKKIIRCEVLYKVIVPNLLSKSFKRQRKEILKPLNS